MDETGVPVARLIDDTGTLAVELLADVGALDGLADSWVEYDDWDILDWLASCGEFVDCWLDRLCELIDEVLVSRLEEAVGFIVETLEYVGSILDSLLVNIDEDGNISLEGVDKLLNNSRGETA